MGAGGIVTHIVYTLQFLTKGSGRAPAPQSVAVAMESSRSCSHHLQKVVAMKPTENGMFERMQLQLQPTSCIPHPLSNY